MTFMECLAIYLGSYVCLAALAHIRDGGKRPDIPRPNIPDPVRAYMMRLQNWEQEPPPDPIDVTEVRDLNRGGSSYWVGEGKPKPLRGSNIDSTNRDSKPYDEHNGNTP